jgi:hypothetical protein
MDVGRCRARERHPSKIRELRRPQDVSDSQEGRSSGQTARRSARTSRTGPLDRVDEDLDELVAPLVELCERLHLVGVTNRSRLRRALSSFEADQIRHAVRLIYTQVRAGVSFRSPVGLLVRLAEARDTTYFPLPQVIGCQPLLAANDPAAEPHDDPIGDLDDETIAALHHLPASVRERLLASRRSPVGDDLAATSAR